MASTERQNRLLLAEDWKKVYQSFKYADFQSYDFDTLRRTMINYIRQNYPEDFNDYIESSEYLALIDLIAFLGQNLAFRTDLNARENYLETAERRESVLRLARLVSYNPKRNQAANGFLKIESIQTTEDIIDGNGQNLSGQTVEWNDSTNADWYEQFIKILNSALPADAKFGKSIKKSKIDSVLTEQYRLNSTGSSLPVYSFQKNIDSITTPFEIVSTTIDDTTIYEEEPLPGNRLGFIYRDDGQGAGSSNSGFFCHFRQGRLENNTFQISNPTPNTTVNIDTDNINNTDVWLYKLDSSNLESELWNKVDSIEGNNIIYNSINKKVTDIYSVLSRVEDRIALIFSDGTFGKLPKGNFKVYYRTSNNRNYKIVPTDMSGVTITIPYTSAAGKQESVTFVMELKNVIENGASAESNSSIKTNAPLIIHSRDAENETFNILNNYKDQDLKILMHCFTGSKDFAKKLLTLNAFFSASGIITFKNSLDLQETFKFLPLDKILIETDSPFLAPVPNRGKKNEPSFIDFTANKLSELRDISKTELIQSTTSNFNKLFFN